MNERDETRLRDMLDAARKMREFTANKTRDSLDTEEILSLALVRLIEIIGEAANNVSSETRASLLNIPWKNIVGMRNKVIHDYIDVDYDVVWKTVTESVPELIVELEKTVSSENK